MTNDDDLAKKTFHEDVKESEDRKTSEERKKERLAYIYTYIHNIRHSLSSSESPDLHKVHTLLSIDQSIHEVAKFLASVLNTTMSDLFAEAFLKELENLAAKLPESIVFNIVHQLPMPRDVSDDMLDLEVDLTREKLSSVVQRIKALDKTPTHQECEKKKFLIESLEKQLSKAIKVARRSKDLDFQQFVADTRECLRVHESWRTPVKVVQRRVE